MERLSCFIGFKCYDHYCFLGCLAILLLCYCNAIESPPYIVVRSEQDVEIRLYQESSWLSALVHGSTSFQKSTKDGFNRLYQYIHGANLNSSKLSITAPVLTSIINNNTTSALHESNYAVMLYMPAKYEAGLPQPYPELNLVNVKWNSHCVAVRKFSGFAKDDNVKGEIEALATSLGKILTGKTANVENKSYAIAQYNASFRLTGRLNEVWVNVTAEGCPSY